ARDRRDRPEPCDRETDQEHPDGMAPIHRADNRSRGPQVKRTAPHNADAVRHVPTLVANFTKRAVNAQSHIGPAVIAWRSLATRAGCAGLPCVRASDPSPGAHAARSHDAPSEKLRT